MNWNKFYSLRSFSRSSLWIIPFIAIPFYLVATRILHWLDAWLGWTLMGYSVPGAQAMLQAIVTSTLSFVVFTFGSLLVAIQVASAQLTPRIIATTLLRNNVVKYTVALFTFTLLFALSAQNRMEKDVHQLVMFLAALLGMSSFASILPSDRLRIAITTPCQYLGTRGRRRARGHRKRISRSEFRSGHPGRRTPQTPPAGPHHSASRDIGYCSGGQSQALMAEAERSNGVIEFVPQVGDFVAVDEPLFNLYGGTRSIDEGTLHSSIVFGSERTMEQDPTFAFRIVADIALRALSPAINDPTTAVLAIDQLHRMLRMVGKRHLRTDELSDKSGTLRLIFRTPNWEDFVHLAFSEIRSCGSNNLQIVRRLRAMIQNLIQTLPAHRHPALQQELSLLEREIERNFTYPEELALAQVADAQGLGGHSGRHVTTST